MINLFGKLFIGFWLALMAIVGSWLLAGQYLLESGELGFETLQPPGAPPDRAAPGMPPPRQMYRLFYGLQSVPAEQLRDWIREQERRHPIEIFLVTAEGSDYFGRSLAAGTDTVLAKLGQYRRRAMHREDGVMLFAQAINRPDTGNLTMVIASHRLSSPLVRFLTEQLWLRILLALLVSGLLAYLASRYLTRPIKDLQQASRSLAGGDLDTRIAVPAQGGDETAELGRTFNRMAGELQDKIRAQEQLLADVSHELRSPLARLRVALALAQREPAHGAGQLQRIEREAERLEELIAQLLALPERELELDDSIDLVILLRELAEDARFEAQASGKTVALSTDLDQAIVSSHGDLLKKALENVIRNALNYSPASSVVDIRLDQRAGRLHLSIRDRGPGVAEEDLARIFQPFYRTDRARQRETGGHGLGLAIAYRAINQHGGELSARNADPGLEVVICLPLQGSDSAS